MVVTYRPVKLSNREDIDFFRCMPTIEGADGVTLSGKSVLKHDRNIMVTAKENAALLNCAFNDLSDAHERGDQIRLIVPVNSYALASTEASSLIIQEFKKLSPSIRQAVILDVFDFPNPLTLEILDGISILLMPFFDKLMAEPAADMDDFSVFANCNYFGVSMDLEAQNLQGDEAMNRMTKFWGAATKRRLKVIMQGISATDLSEKASRLEVFLQDGPYISGDIPKPLPFTL